MRQFVVVLLVGLLSACAAVGGGSTAVEGAEHWVQGTSALDERPIRLYVWEKRRRDIDPRRYASDGKIVLLASGATTPGSVFFDVQVPGAAQSPHSLMDYLAAHGYDVFTLDYQNYGRSEGHACGRCVTTSAAARDIDAVVDYVRSLRGTKSVYLLGWSWGAETTGMFAMSQPEKVRRLVLYAPPVWEGPRGKVPTEEFRPVTEAGSRKLFTPGAAEPAAIDAFVAAATKFRQAPNGVMIDLRSRMPLIDPARIAAPTLVILGEKDRLTPVSQKELPGFFAALANPDKQFSVIPGGGHALLLETPRARFQFEVLKWFWVDQRGPLEVAGN